MKEMENIQKTQAAVISAKVGARLKINLIKKAQENNVQILNNIDSAPPSPRSLITCAIFILNVQFLLMP
jgi:hypothetical protein